MSPNSVAAAKEVTNSGSKQRSSFAPVAIHSPPAFDVRKRGGQRLLCESRRYRSEEDICAQWQAADAAVEAAKYSFWSLIVAAVGTFGLLISLYYTRKAVISSEEANTDADAALAIAERNAEAAHRQVLVAQDIAQRQLRPYIGIQGAVFAPPGTPPNDGFHITWRNFGQTPANNIDMSYSIGFSNGPYDGDVVGGIDWNPSTTRRSIDLPPSQTATNLVKIGEDEREIIRSIMRGESALDALCKAVVSYDDGFGVRRTTIIVISVEPQQMARMEAGVAYSRGD